MTLAVKANYAVCEKICLPARATLELRLPAGEATPWTAEIAGAFARVPQSVDAATLGLELTATGERDWRLCWPARAGGASDLFIEPPAGWWIATKAEPAAGAACFGLSLREAPADAKFPVDARATIVGPAGAQETMLSLSPKR